MRDFFYQDKSKLKSTEGDTVSTLLVPENLLPILEKLNESESLKLILKRFLKKYKFLFFSGATRFSNKVRIQYQEEGLNLKAIKFRPDLKDWMELGIIAYSLGFSRCFLFSFFLSLEGSPFSELADDPKVRVVVATQTRSQVKGLWELRRGRSAFIQKLSLTRVT